MPVKALEQGERNKDFMTLVLSNHARVSQFGVIQEQKLAFIN